MNDAVDAVRAPALWPRRAIVGLWLLAFAAAGVGLALRWDALVARLARPPVMGDDGGARVR